MQFILIFTTLIVLLTIGTGIFMMYKNMGSKKMLKKILRVNLFIFLPLLIGVIIILVPQAISADRKSVV